MVIRLVFLTLHPGVATVAASNWRDLGLFPVSQPPPVCKPCDTICSAGLPVFSSPEQNTEQKSDKTRAIDLGNRTSNAFAPWVAAGCDAAMGCGQVTLPGFENRKANDQFVAEATLRVPVVSPLFRVLFPDGRMKISYRSHERPERAFVQEDFKR